MKIKVYIVGGQRDYINVMRSLSTFDIDIERTMKPSDADIVIFTGGSDVDPSLYDETKHFSTHSNITRDKEELELFNYFKLRKKPMLGICRGAQFLTVVNGGKLVQDVCGHALYHKHAISFNNGKTINITSTHHQMMYPYEMNNKDYELVAWSTISLGKSYVKNHKENYPNLKKEPEIVFYNKTKSLCIQGHPERQTLDTKVMEVIGETINKYLLQ